MLALKPHHPLAAHVPFHLAKAGDPRGRVLVVRYIAIKRKHLLLVDIASCTVMSWRAVAAPPAAHLLIHLAEDRDPCRCLVAAFNMIRC